MRSWQEPEEGSSKKARRNAPENAQPINSIKKRISKWRRVIGGKGIRVRVRIRIKKYTYSHKTTEKAETSFPRTDNLLKCKRFGQFNLKKKNVQKMQSPKQEGHCRRVAGSLSHPHLQDMGRHRRSQAIRRSHTHTHAPPEREKERRRVHSASAKKRTRQRESSRVEMEKQKPCRTVFPAGVEQFSSAGALSSAGKIWSSVTYCM